MPSRRSRRQQRGALTVLFVLMLLALLGFIALTLDLGRVFNRRVELQAVADGIALAGAAQLNGKADGVTAALAQAGATAAAMRVQNDGQPVLWHDAALAFGAAPDGPWLDAGAALAQPARLWYVQADTGRLRAPASAVRLFFMRVLAPALVSTPVAVKSVAGRAGIDVTPLAVCAMATEAAIARANPGPPVAVELVEYGFRRGVAYDLMQLNPHGAGAEHFVVDPHALAGAATGPVTADMAAPYVCAGELALPQVTGASLRVGRPFPLPALYRQLNSRFNLYPGAQCASATAPPDRNIRAYFHDSAVPWMNSPAEGQGAQLLVSGARRWTVADPLPAPAGTQAKHYGPLWAYARAVPYSAWVDGADEPAGGYTPFGPADWAALYAPAAPVAKNYPSGSATPYMASTGTNVLAPPATDKGIGNRRVLHVPLLACPVAAGATAEATVLALGRFLMTVPATETSLYAEFGGVAAEHGLSGPVQLFR